MEVLTGDRENEFPPQIAPFPESADLTAVNVPPQKLRPIRRFSAEDRPSFVDLMKGESSAYFEAASADVAEQFGSGMVAVAEEEESLGGPKFEWCGGLESLSSSSSDDEDLFADVTEPGNRKRKRIKREKMETFMENLVMKIMDRQEQMHKQLIEMIEKRDRERIIREEAWKQQEMERMKRDEEIRAQETSRSLALISFIQNFLGDEIQIPHPLPVSSIEENGGNMSNPSNKRWPEAIDPNRRWPEAIDPNRRWPETEVQALIMLRTALEQKLRVMGSKCSIWDEISVGMRNMGYDRSAKKCKEKWENINKYFRRSMGNGKKHLDNSKTCPYFHDLDIVYKNGLVNPGNAYENVAKINASNLTNYENVAKIEDEHLL